MADSPACSRNMYSKIYKCQQDKRNAGMWQPKDISRRI